MLTLAPNLRIYLHARPTDMRKSFEGLCALVRNVFQADPLDGSLFLFVNRRGDRLKMLWWDRAPEVTLETPRRNLPGIPC